MIYDAVILYNVVYNWKKKDFKVIQWKTLLEFASISSYFCRLRVQIPCQYLNGNLSILIQQVLKSKFPMVRQICKYAMVSYYSTLSSCAVIGYKPSQKYDRGKLKDKFKNLLLWFKFKKIWPCSGPSLTWNWFMGISMYWLQLISHCKRIIFFDY